MATMEGRQPTIVTNAEVQRTAPSLVAYIKGGDRLVGMIAKRFNGRKMNEVDEESKQVSFRVVRDGNINVKLDCLAIGKQFATEEIFAQVISVSDVVKISGNNLAGEAQLHDFTLNLKWSRVGNFYMFLIQEKALVHLFLIQNYYFTRDDVGFPQYHQFSPEERISLSNRSRIHPPRCIHTHLQLKDGRMFGCKFQKLHYCGGALSIARKYLLL